MGSDTCETCRFRSDGPHYNSDRGTAEFHDIMFACKRRARNNIETIIEALREKGL